MSNHVTINGIVDGPPRTFAMKSGQTVVNFTLIHRENYKGRDGADKRKDTIVVCVAFTKHPEYYTDILVLGNLILVDGKLVTEAWEGKDGKSKTFTKVQAEQTCLVRRVGTEEEQQNPAPTPKAKPPSADESQADADGTPF